MQANETGEKTLHFGNGEPPIPHERPVWRSIRRGMLNRCPACGTGRLFRAFVKPADHCTACGQDFTPQRSDDLPPYIVITIVGHIVVAGYMATDLVWVLETWQYLMIWVPITIIMAIALLQPVKGGTIGLQWALRMHGFGDTPADDDGKPAHGDPAA